MWYFSRGPSKYTRKWEDESAYAKQNATPQPRNPRPEDFPELGSKGERRNKSSYQDQQEEKENKSRQDYQIDGDNRNYPSRMQNSSHHIDRRDSDRRDNDRHESDRRDNSRSRRQYDRYESSKTFIFFFCFSLYE